MDRNEAIEIPFGAKDSELKGWEYTIPEGMEARIKDGKIIVREKESEDERIKNEIIAFIEQSIHRGGGTPIPEEQEAKWLAWLEKQGEQKQPTKYTLEQAARIFLDALSDTPYNNKPVTDAQVITRELLKFLSDARSYNPDALNEQNPAWSEEDEKNIEKLGGFLTEVFCYGHVYVSQKDKEELQSWLKSLKERYTWKPSESDILLLERIANGKSNPQDFQASLCGLIGQLKELKG